MASWSSSIFGNAWITMNGSWGNMGDYNMTITFNGASDYGAVETIKLLVCSTENGTYQTISSKAATTETLKTCTFSFDISDYITPVSLQKVYFRMQFVKEDGSTSTSSLTSGDMKTVFGDDEKATMIYVKANEPPSTLTFTTSNSSYQDFDKPLTISWNSVTKTGSYAPDHYKIWIRFSYDDGKTWQDNDNNYIATGWGVEGTSFEFTIKNLRLDTKNLDAHARFKLKILIATLDNPIGDIEATRSSIKTFIMSQYVINTSSSNVIMKSGSDFITIKRNNLKQINGTVNTSDMKIKIMDDGSEWARIFWHDVSSTATYFTDEDEVKDCSLSNRYSRLNMVNNFLYNGKYEFMLCYPKHSTTKYNRWIQIANPLTTTGDASQTAITMGYEPVHIDFTTNWKYGFALSTSTSTYMDCEAGHGNWFGAIGQYKAYTASGITGFPAPTESGMDTAQKEVELWVRVYRNVDITPKEKKNEVYIKTESDFWQFCSDVSNGNDYEGKTVFLLTDIWTSGASEHVDFVPAGDENRQFKGVFDGQGHTLNIQYIDLEYNYTGFIGYNMGIIRNLCVSNMYMGAFNYCGLICGYNGGLIENCYASGTITESRGEGESNVLYAGGITGDNTGVIRKCISSVNVSISPDTGGTDVGGIAGRNSGEILSCRNVGEVSGYISGGIVGWNYVIGSSITRCTNFGTIDGVWSGGIAGYTYRGIVEDCLNAGSGASAGIIGMSEYGTSNNCYYASNYNLVGMVFTDTGHTDTTNKVTLSSMKNDSMAQKLGSAFFFYDTSWDSWTGSLTEQFMKFNWEKTIGWTIGDGSYDFDIFGAIQSDGRLIVNIIANWDDSEGIAEEFRLLVDGNLCRVIKNPTRTMEITLLPTDGIVENTTYEITGQWHHFKSNSVTTQSAQIHTTTGAQACFEEGTEILTKNGLVPIENIKEQDFVLSKNVETGQIEEQKVYHTYTHNPRSCL